MKKTFDRRFLPIALALLGALLLLSFFLLAKTQSSSETPSEEEALACFLEQGKGVGKASVSLCRDPANGRIVGAAVVCEGGDDPRVRAEITRLLCAALGIGANRVYVSAAKT